MPDDRFLHPRLMNSEKISALTHLEYRVWTIAELVSDDFGVMPDEGRLLSAKDRALGREPDDVIRAALTRVVTIGLRLRFAHQSQLFLCAPWWQDFQHVRHPRQTYLPCPPVETLVECSVETVRLFRDFHRSFPEVFPKKFWKKSGKVQSLARAGGRETANGLRPEALGSDGGGAGGPAAGSGAGAERRETARRILAFLNECAGRSFRPVATNLDFIMARLKDGATEANCRGVIVRKARKWKDDPKMAEYLRPETLFNRTKFESYLGERPPEAPDAVSPVR